MRITTSQLRRIIKEEASLIAEAAGSSDVDSLLMLFPDVSDVSEISDDELQSVVVAARVASAEISNRRREFVAMTPLGERLVPVDSRDVFRYTKLTPGEAKKNGLVNFFKDGNTYYAETTSGMLWKEDSYGKFKTTGKTAADFKASRKRR